MPPPFFPSPSVHLLLFLLFPLAYFIPFSSSAQAPYAQGNLAIIFDAKSGRTSDSHPQLANLTELWCQATKTDHDRLPIKSAKFTHVLPPPMRKRQAEVTEDHRAHLRFGTVTTSAIGKYKCEITTMDDEFVQGNLFVYMRPVFHVNASLRLDEEDRFKFTGSIHRVGRGAMARLLCPAIGYPIPAIEWFRDEKRIVPDDKYVLVGSQLHIENAEEKDEGVYRCIASNEFPTEIDGEEQRFEVQLDQQLVVSNPWDWILPLIIIVLTLIALLVIIYGCAAWKQYKHNQYNVAKREKKMRRAEEQNLQEPDLEEDE